MAETKGTQLRYTVRTETVAFTPEYVVWDTNLNYGVRRSRSLDQAEQIRDDLNARWEKMSAAEAHRIGYSTNRRGGSAIAGGGNFRESSVYCSCGWEQSYNGQTYQESVQAGREHLKDMDVYTTPLEQTVYAHITPKNVLATQIAAASDKTIGRVQKVLDKLVERGNVEEYKPGCYRTTGKFFSWND